MRKQNVRMWALAIVICIFGCLGIKEDVYAAKNITIGKTIKDTVLEDDDKKYILNLKNKSKIKITVSVDAVSSCDEYDEEDIWDDEEDIWDDEEDIWDDEEDIWDDEEESLLVSVTKKGEIFDEIEDWEIEAGQKESKTVILEKGTYIIYSEGFGGKLNYSITVKDVSTYAKKIKISKSKLSLYAGDSTKLKTSVVKPQKGYVKGITWKSSNKKIATVDKNGKVIGKKAGKCTISAKLSGGNTVKCKVTVKKAPYLYIKKAGFYIDSAGGVKPNITIKNNFKKKIKYMYLDVSFSNAVGDPAMCKFWERNRVNLRIVGPLAKGKTETYYWNPVIYNYSTRKMYIKSATVIFMDGSSKIVSIKKSFK